MHSTTFDDPVARLGPGTRLAWLFGCTPELIKNVAWDMFVLFYYTQVVGLSGSLLGLALALILICDALIDPYVGTLSDRLQRAPLGRRHTLMAAAIIPFAVGLIGVFSPPRTLDQIGLFAWLTGFGLLARISISFYTVPALALGAELSRDPEERNVIAMLRNVGNNIATLLVPFLAFQWFFQPTAAFPKGQLNPEPYASFGFTVAVLAAGAMLFAIIGTRARLKALEAREPPRHSGSGGLIATFNEFATAIRLTPNVPRLMALVFLVLVTLATINQLTLHLSTYLWQLNASQNQMVLMAGTAGSLVGVVLAVRIARRFEHRWVMRCGLIGFFVCIVLTIALPLAGLGPAAGSEPMGWYVCGCRFLGGLSYGLYLVPLGALILDIGDEHEVNTGRPQQGLVAAVHFLGLQAASAVVGLVAGVFLDVIAFPIGVPVAQMPATKIQLLGLFVVAIIVIASALLVSVVSSLDMSRERQASIARRLIALRTGASSTTMSAPAHAQPAAQ